MLKKAVQTLFLLYHHSQAHLYCCTRSGLIIIRDKIILTIASTTCINGGLEMNARIDIPKEEIAEFCERNRIRRLVLFGSVIRDDFTTDSDVDVLVEFEPDAGVGLFKLYDMEQELCKILNVKKVDLNTIKSLSKHFREEALEQLEVLHST